MPHTHAHQQQQVLRQLLMEDSASSDSSDPNTSSNHHLAPALLRAIESTSLPPKDAVSLLLFALPLRTAAGGDDDASSCGLLPFHLRTAVRDSVARRVLGAAKAEKDGEAQVSE